MDSNKTQVKLSSGWKMLAIICSSYIYDPIRRYYILRASKSVNVSRFPSISEHYRCRISPLNHQVVESSPPEQNIPSLPNSWKFYCALSNMVHLMSWLQSGSLMIIFELPQLDKSWNCYVPGRASLHSSFIGSMHYFQWLCDLWLFYWRKIIPYLEQTYRLDGLFFIMFDQSRLAEHLSIQEKSKSKTGSAFLRDILYLEAKFQDDNFRYLLRPNRTVLAHKKLSQTVENVWFWCAGLAVCLFLLIVPSILNVTLFDCYYIKNYPGCRPDLDKLHEQNKLSRWSISFQLLDFRWFYQLFDLILNYFIFSDIILGTLIPNGVAIILLQDLIIYWSHIRVKLDKKLDELKLRSIIHNGGYYINSKDSKLISERPRKYFFEKHSTPRRKTSKSANELHILQSEIMDFFAQLNYYDRFVSNFISIAFQIWVSMFLATSFMTINIESASGLATFRFVQVLGCGALSIPVYSLVRLSKATRNAYPIISAIMAHEKDLKRKAWWSSLLECFDRQKFGFTLLHSYPLTWLSYLNCIGTSVSFLVLFETYRTANH